MISASSTDYASQDHQCRIRQTTAALEPADRSKGNEAVEISYSKKKERKKKKKKNLTRIADPIEHFELEINSRREAKLIKRRKNQISDTTAFEKREKSQIKFQNGDLKECNNESVINDSNATIIEEDEKKKPVYVKEVENKELINEEKIADCESKPHKLLGKKQKETKKKIQQPSSSDLKTSLCCIVCNTSFNSKNKLFSHLKATGHATVNNNKAARVRK